MQAQKPKQAVETISSVKTSVAAIKNSIRIMASAVAFQRGLFPNDSFKQRNYCGIDLMILSPDKKGKGPPAVASTFMDYLEKGVFDAFEKGYADRIMLNIHETDPAEELSNIIESYSFRLDYDRGRIVEDGKAQRHFRKKDAAKDAEQAARGKVSREKVVSQTRAMIKTLTSSMAGLPGLPEEKWVTFYITYHDHTPSEYEPPMFQAAVLGGIPVFKTPAQTFKQGVTSTGYHDLSLKLRMCDSDGVEEEDNEDDKAAAVAAAAAMEEGKDDDDDDDEEGGVEDDETSSAEAILASSMAKATLEAKEQADETPMDEWEATKERLYASLAQTLLKHPGDDPRELIAQTEYGYSISARLLDDFLERFAREHPAALHDGGRAPLAPIQQRTKKKKMVRVAAAQLVEEDPAEEGKGADDAEGEWSEGANHMKMLRCSQDSFADEEENIAKVSRSKRPLHCDPRGNAGGSGGSMAASKAKKKKVKRSRR